MESRECEFDLVFLVSMNESKKNSERGECDIYRVRVGCN